MKRDRIVKFLFKDAKKLPKRCKDLKEIEELLPKFHFHFEIIQRFLEESSLEITAEEIPEGNSLGQIYLYLILLEKTYGIYLLDWEIFNPFDTIMESVHSIKEIFSIQPDTERFLPTLEEFLDYMKSDNPDL